jgi:Zn-dependent M28 family amino/carboxypeptidase
MVNLRATLPAAGAASKQRLVIGGHYDTKLFKEFTFVGANDGGSSAAFLIELARALKGRANRVAIELLFLDGEESTGDWQGQDHTYGSRYYVENAKKTGTLATLKALILVDMIGDRNLNLKREANSTGWMTDAIWDAADRLKLQPHFLDERTPIEDDHIPFLQANVPSVDLIDFDYDPWHTAEDTLDKISARSLEVVGRVVMEALPAIEVRLLKATANQK